MVSILFRQNQQRPPVDLPRAILGKALQPAAYARKHIFREPVPQSGKQGLFPCLARIKQRQPLVDENAGGCLHALGGVGAQLDLGHLNPMAHKFDLSILSARKEQGPVFPQMWRTTRKRTC